MPTQADFSSAFFAGLAGEWTDNGRDVCEVAAMFQGLSGPVLVVRWSNCDRGIDGAELCDVESFAALFRRYVRPAPAPLAYVPHFGTAADLVDRCEIPRVDLPVHTLGS